MKVFLLSNLENNPYHSSLVNYLKSQNIKLKGGEYNYGSIFFLSKILQQGKPDIFHIHDIHFFLQGKKNQRKLIHEQDILRRPLKYFILVIQLLILILFNVKVIWTVHELNEKYVNGRQEISGIWAIILGRLFDRIITHSYFTKQQITTAMSLSRQKKACVIYHGNYIGAYENTISNSKARDLLGIKQNKLVFLLFGNIYRNKGFLEAIDNFQKISSHNTCLLIAGRLGELDIGEIIHQKIKAFPNIIFTPAKIADKDIQVYMNACDCVILPYKVFTTSGVAILAMSFAKACIAPNLGFFTEVLDDSGGFLFDPKAKEALLDAMKQAVDQKNILIQMGKYNLTKAKKWDWDLIGKQTVNVYQQSLMRK